MKRYWPNDYGLSARILKKFMKYRFEAVLFVTVTSIILSASYFTSMFLASFAGVFLSFVLQNSLRRKEARNMVILIRCFDGEFVNIDGRQYPLVSTGGLP